MREVDPFDLPDWLGEGDVTWAPEAGVRRGHLVRGRLSGSGDAMLECDLLAVDEAHPSPVAPDATRTAAHLAWRHDQILLVEHNDRLTLLVPGTAFTADLVLVAIARLAKALGASPESYAVLLRIGDGR